MANRHFSLLLELRISLIMKKKGSDKE